ncbi:hypothetical protein ACTPOK_41100 [Streptomyces inhibens]|uniref:hypothetical protein n=1 Tax=Streptomyces inhibens TaxID=2293571 RepID=UPI00402AEB52
MAFAEFHRVLAPGAHLLLALKVGEERRHLDQAYGHEPSLYVYWIPSDHVSDMLSKSGLVMDAQLIREPDETENPR